MPSGDPHLLLAPLCAAAAAGRLDAVAPAVRAALAGGCTGEEVREALRTIVPYLGFPRTFDALAAARDALPPPAMTPDVAPAEWPGRGMRFFDRVYGADASRVRVNLRALDPDVADWVAHDAYGKVLSRAGLPEATRELIGVVLLASQGLRNQLSGHVRGALHCGATREDVAAFLDAAAAFLPPADLEFARATLARVAGEGARTAPPS
jgi:4-carboxymuconolactone decarboxylase